MAWRELLHVREDRGVARRVEKREIVVERRGIEIARDPSPRAAISARPEIEAAARHGVVHRLDADAIAGDEQRLRPFVPDRQAEHPAQPSDRAFAPFLRVHDDFGVGGRIETMAGGLSSRRSSRKLDLPVEDNRTEPSSL